MVCFILKISSSIFHLGGKCGICGEPYDRSVKLFEKGGKMYIGKIVKTYLQGQQIDVKIKVK
jgi:hypothetical protein